MLPEDEKLLRLAEAATPGPWETRVLKSDCASCSRQGVQRKGIVSKDIEIIAEGHDPVLPKEHDWDYIVATTNAVPRLLKRIEALRDALGNCLYADGNAGEAQCAVKTAERALAADEAAAKEQG